MLDDVDQARHLLDRIVEAASARWGPPTKSRVTRKGPACSVYEWSRDSAIVRICCRSVCYELGSDADGRIRNLRDFFEITTDIFPRSKVDDDTDRRQQSLTPVPRRNRAYRRSSFFTDTIESVRQVECALDDVDSACEGMNDANSLHDFGCDKS